MDELKSRFVRLLIDTGHSVFVECWGILLEAASALPVGRDSFLPLWAPTADAWQSVIEEFGVELDPAGLMDTEVKTAVDAGKCDTPDAAWAALAAFKLTGTRMSDFVKE